MTNSTRLYIVVVPLLCLTAMGAAPEKDAVEKYRAYVDAVRAGKFADVLKLVEPVPDGVKQLRLGKVDQLVAVESLKAEMIAPFGAGESAEAASRIGGIPTAETLKTLRAVPSGDRMVGLFVADPVSKTGGMAGWMIRTDDGWTIPAGMLLDLPPAEKFVEPGPALRERMQRYIAAITKAAKAVHGRLKAREFKTAGDVATAFGQAIEKSRG